MSDCQALTNIQQDHDNDREASGPISLGGTEFCAYDRSGIFETRLLTSGKIGLSVVLSVRKLLYSFRQR